jgi:integrase/recombinase XerD
MRSTNTFSVQFIIRLQKNNSSIASLYVRINVNKKRLEISLKQQLNPAFWDAAGECIKGNKLLSAQIDPYIRDTRFKLTECYRQLQAAHEVVTADKIKRLFTGETISESTVCGLLKYHNEHMKTVLSPGTLKNYSTTEKYLKAFIQCRFRRNDISLSELNYQFITEFEFFLRKTQPLQLNNPLGNNGIMKHMERLKKMAALATKMEWITKNPFTAYQLRFQKREMNFLSQEDIIKIEKAVLNKKLDKARDMFLFSCYTSLAYVDLINLKSNNICMGIHGEHWIRTTRQKTDIPVNVPLLPKPMELLEKYKNDPSISNQGLLLPNMSNQKVNNYLKDIAAICNIHMHLNFHLARHSFSTTITLANGIPLETVSKMLGHTKLSTTQIYVHVLEKKIGDDMLLLKQKFGKPPGHNLVVR